MPKIAFQEIRPRTGYPNFGAFIQTLEKTLDDKVKPELLAQFEDVVADWEHKPEFRARKRVTPDWVAVYIYPAGEHKPKWIWVSGGTRAHTIVPRNAGVPLRFRTDYKPRTFAKGGQRYGGAGISVGPWVAAKSVEHSGIEPREFEKEISKRYRPRFARHMARATRIGTSKL